jgi:hypothetical protein
LAISRPIVVITCIIASSESWGPYQRPHPWHSRAGGGAVHSINSGHSRAGPLKAPHGPDPVDRIGSYRGISTAEMAMMLSMEARGAIRSMPVAAMPSLYPTCKPPSATDYIGGGAEDAASFSCTVP